MSDMDALDKLIEAVEAGTDTMNHHAAAFPGESAYGLCTWHRTHKAAGGSLDAALALHEALLPGWVWDVGKEGTAWTDEKRGLRRLGHKAAVDAKPSRALLIATLCAYRASMNEVK